MKNRVNRCLSRILGKNRYWIMANYKLNSGNVFKDLELPSPDERLAKAKLAYKINTLIAEQGMTQRDAANCLEISRYKMTQLRNGRLNSFTVDDLESLLKNYRIIPKFIPTTV